ncbi:MAG: hypothetical protein R3240_04655 [Gammaproteobacteria bacterium]|nr:hypothetical protein [Gammaproteobacteria bacterium]
MNKNSLDTFVTSVAFVGGLVISIGHNPLLGIGTLLAVLTTWNFAPKLMKAKAAIHHG